MKAITALNLLKKHGLCHEDFRLRELKLVREILGIEKWEDYIRFTMFGHYLYGDMDDDEIIRIPEVGMQIGGTVTIRLDGVFE